MKVTLCHNAVVPPREYGGTERVIDWLCRGLRELGHEPTLIAAPGSRSEFAEVITPADFSTWPKRVPSDTEVLHLWGTPSVTPPRPFLVTIEGNGKPGELFHPNTVFVSKRHAENHGSTHFVYNGLVADDYVATRPKGKFAVFLAKASWDVKNLKGALHVAREAGWRIEVLGSRSWPLGLHRLRPSIGGVKYRGMVGDAEKREILSRASALLFPVRWNEPFGIAITEALASGCFVLGTPYGSLPEIVTPDVGQLSANASDLIATLKNPPAKFTPQACRQRVVSGGFTHLDMARAYVRYYEQILANNRLGAGTTAPSLRLDRVPAQLLEWNE